MLRIDTLSDGSNNFTVSVTGTLHENLEFEELLDLSALKGANERCRLESISWVIQEKLGLTLWWDKDNLILPLESRNFFRIETPLKPPAQWDRKFRLSSFNLTIPPMHFLVILDFHR